MRAEIGIIVYHFLHQTPPNGERHVVIPLNFDGAANRLVSTALCIGRKAWLGKCGAWNIPFVKIVSKMSKSVQNR